jgi:predicted TIM-barrel fold metal-dependent hydrolase
MAPVVDTWVNAHSPLSWRGTTFLESENVALSGVIDGRYDAARMVTDNIALMNRLGIDRTVLVTTLGADGTDPDHPSVEQLDAYTSECADRFWFSAFIDDPHDPVANVERIRALAHNRRFVLVQVIPLLRQISLDDRLYYPIYTTCAELGLPVAINVGQPGPPVRSFCQDPRLLEHVLLDFPRLRVIACHLGHPDERLLVTYLRRFPNLTVSTSGWLADEMASEIRDALRSPLGRSRLVWASDHPLHSMARAIDAARALDLDDETRAAYLGGTAHALLARD